MTVQNQPFNTLFFSFRHIIKKNYIFACYWIFHYNVNLLALTGVVIFMTKWSFWLFIRFLFMEAELFELVPGFITLKLSKDSIAEFRLYHIRYSFSKSRFIL